MAKIFDDEKRAERFDEVMRSGNGKIEIVILFEEVEPVLMQACAHGHPEAMATFAVMNSVVEDNAHGDGDKVCLLCHEPVMIMVSETERGGVPGYVKAMIDDPSVTVHPTIGFVICNSCLRLERSVVRQRVVDAVAKTAGVTVVRQLTGDGKDTLH